MAETKTLTMDDLFKHLEDFVTPRMPDGRRDDNKWGNCEVYWISRSSDLATLEKYPILEPFVFIRDGNESPIIEVGWLVKDGFKRMRTLNRTSGEVFILATIKLFCSDEQAWAIAQEISKDFRRFTGFGW